RLQSQLRVYSRRSINLHICRGLKRPEPGCRDFHLVAPSEKMGLLVVSASVRRRLIIDTPIDICDRDDRIGHYCSAGIANRADDVAVDPLAPGTPATCE